MWFESADKPGYVSKKRAFTKGISCGKTQSLQRHLISRSFVGSVSEDDVIEDFDLQDLSGAEQATRDAVISFGRGGITEG